jgi:hypothetical protein
MTALAQGYQIGLIVFLATIQQPFQVVDLVR